MEELSFWDSSCALGMRGIVHPGSFYRAEELLERMDHYGIEKAWVYHSLAREYDPAEGNRQLLDICALHDRLMPVWVVMPHHTGEFPAPEALMEAMKNSGVRLVRMFPSTAEQYFSMGEWSAGPLLRELERHRVPLMLGADQLGWEEWHALCSAYPGLPLIMTDVTYRMDRNLYPLLELFPNLHIESFGYKVHMGIEQLCRRFGAKRLIFGSGMPVSSGASAVSMIRYAMIDEEEKKRIAGGNLDALIKGVSL